MMSKSALRAAWGALVLACLLVMVRQIFVGLEIDEVYALSLGFRLVQGDRLFATMWEPHQLSALADAGVNVRLIDQGSSELNIIVGVQNDDFEVAMRAIYASLTKEG